MRRSKSNPAKYARNYRSISQRRMTAHDGLDEEKEMKRLRKILEEEDRKLSKDKESRESKRKRPEDQNDADEGILSKDLMADQDGYGNDSENPVILTGKKKKKAKTKKEVQLTPQEIRQAKQLQKNASRKLKQLETRAAQKEKRKHLYQKLQETALSQEKMKLLSASATLGKTFSKKEQLKKLLEKERAGIKLTEEEHDLLYRDRDEPGKETSEAPSVEKSQKGSKKQPKKDSTKEKVALRPKDEKAENNESEAKRSKKQKENKTLSDDPKLADATEDPSPPSASSFAAQMMASLSVLKSTSALQSEKAEKERREADERRKAEEQSRFKPKKKYVPDAPVVLQTPASLGIKTDAAAGKRRKSVHRIREVERPEDVSAMRYDLPVAAMEFEVMDAIRNNDVIIVCSETGSGKSTQVCRLYSGFYDDTL